MLHSTIYSWKHPQSVLHSHVCKDTVKVIIGCLKGLQTLGPSCTHMVRVHPGGTRELKNKPVPHFWSAEVTAQPMVSVSDEDAPWLWLQNKRFLLEVRIASCSTLWLWHITHHIWEWRIILSLGELRAPLMLTRSWVSSFLLQSAWF